MIPHLRGLAAAGAITCALAPADVPATAQSARSSLTAMHQYAAGDPVSDAIAIPDNLQFAPMYRQSLESMLRRSPTFRRQCLRIAVERALTVHLQAAAPFLTQSARALTRIVRQADGRMNAVIYLGRRDNDAELIAHELEHVIEQLDQIDLRTKAALPDTGVHETPMRELAFETTRATRIGLRVAHEVSATDRKAD